MFDFSSVGLLYTVVSMFLLQVCYTVATSFFMWHKTYTCLQI